MTNKNNTKILPSSFRDPSGFLFYKNNILYRQINKSYRKNYDFFLSSMLYKKLEEKKLIICHEDIESIFPDSNCYKIIEPEKINFISYPYEWCFSQLKDAALITLKIQKIALEHGMALKDASAYNIQFHNGRPIFIDTLSFEIYSGGKPWTAYKQFCQHFLGPLALMAYKDIRLGQLARLFIDGPPMDLISKLLPSYTNIKFSILAHIHLHSKAQKRFSESSLNKSRYKMDKNSILALIDSLETAIKKIKWNIADTEWGEYYSITNYSDKAFKDKKDTIENFLNIVKPKELWDLGGNTGIFSRIASDKNIKTICFDIDLAAVEKNYLHSIKNNEKNILPLFLDLTNPSPGLGWAHEERMSLLKRGPVNTIMALALIHHLAISNNLPFDKIAKFFSALCKNLIIEFVPKPDSKVQKLLSTREDIFVDYNQGNFEKNFCKYFIIKKSNKINNSDRIIYLMETK